HDEAWTKVTVVLFNRQIVFLDRLAANIRAQSGAAISRAQLIRALLDAVADADIELTSATSEADLKATLLARLGRYQMLPARRGGCADVRGCDRPECVILVGLPGAGKSTLARSRFPDHTCISKDALPRSGRDKQARQDALLRAALAAGRSVVVDNTNA